MKQRTIVLVARQDDLSRVYEARKQKVTYTRNPVTLLTTEKNKFNEWINGIVKLITDQIPQTEKNNVESTARLSITSLENERGMDVIFFLLVYNIIGHSNGSAAIVPAPAAGERGYEDRSSTPTNLEDLQWTDRPMEESYRRCFLDSFARYNTILRAQCNYYAARTPRYTTVQSSLMPSGAVRQENPKRTVIEDPDRSFKKLRESQPYRTILPDQKSNALIDREITIETDSLLRQSEKLRIALQKADNINTEMLSHTEANLEEILASDRHLLEKTNQDRQRSNLTEAARLREWERSLKYQSHLVECERRDLEQEKQKIIQMTEEFERYRELSAVSVREERRLMVKQRNCLDQNRRDLLAQRSELQRLDLAKSGTFRGMERSLEDQRRGLEQEKQEFMAVQEDIERTGDFNAMNLREKEASLENTRHTLEYTRLELLAERERLRQQEIDNASSLRDRERSMDQDYRAKVERLREKERSMDQDDRTKIESLEEKERSMDQDYRNKIDRLGEKERSMDQDYRTKIDSLEERERLMDQDYRKKIDRLGEKERSIDRDYRAKVSSLLERERSMVQDYRAQLVSLMAMEASMQGRGRGLEQEKQEFMAVRGDFERSNHLNTMDLRKREASLELELLAERERLHQQEIDNASSLRDRKRSLDQDYRARVDRLMDQERSMDQDYRTKMDSLEEKERSIDQDYRNKIDRLREKERSMDRDYRAKVGDLMAMEGSMENQRRALERYQQELGAEKRELEDYYQDKASGLRQKERSVEEQRRSLERQRSNLSTREDELTAQRNRVRSTSPKVIVKKEDPSFIGARSTDKGMKVGFKVKHLPDIFSVEIPWTPW